MSLPEETAETASPGSSICFIFEEDLPVKGVEMEFVL